MPRFRVLAGNHAEYGVTYPKDAVFYSPHNLDQLFANKFERLADPETSATRLSPAPAPVSPVTKEPTVPEKPKESPSKSKDQRSKGKQKQGTTTTLAPETLSGTEVTAEWAAVVDGKFRVFQVEGGYMVYNAETYTPLHKEPLAKEDVADFIREF